MDNKPLKPAETLEVCINTGIAKANSSIGRLVVLGILAGAFIALAAQGSTMAAFNLIADPKTLGVGKALQGAVFGTGLIMVVLAGGELFTGNVLILASVAEKKVTLAKLLRNWVIVYIANLIGSLLVAWLISQSGQWAGGADALGGMTVKIAAGKTALSFGPAFILGMAWAVWGGSWLPFVRRRYGLLLLLSMTLCLVIHRNIWPLAWRLPLQAFIPSALSASLFVFSALLLSMKLRVGNPALDYLGMISYDVYILHGLLLIVLRHECFLYVQDDCLYALLTLTGAVGLGGAYHWLRTRLIGSRRR